MEIDVKNIIKSFDDKIVINNISFSVNKETPTVILGANGSGKSTLLKIIAGIISPDNGQVKFTINNTEISSDHIYAYTAFVAPYSDLIMDFTLSEMVSFQAKFCNPYNGLSCDNVIEIIGLRQFRDAELKTFSSGMMQRVKIGMALLFSRKIILLDEPCNNMDNSSINWYAELLKEYLNNRLLIVCSNNFKHEYPVCNQQINL